MSCGSSYTVGFHGPKIKCHVEGRAHDVHEGIIHVGEGGVVVRWLTDMQDEP